MLIVGPAFEPFFDGAGPTLPNYDVTSLDDEQVKAFMMNIGCGHVICATLPRAPMTRIGLCDTHLIKSHPTHWILFQRFHGFPNARDNGLTLRGYLKSKYTQEQFVKLFEEDCRRGDCDMNSAVISHPKEPNEQHN
jgi:hypothetical protein